MNHHDLKWQYLWTHQDGKCAIIKDRGTKEERAVPHAPVSLHHAKAHNTKVNRFAMPLFIDSVWNLTLVSEYGHEKWRSWGIRSYEYCLRCERFLKRHPRISEWVNCPTGRLFQ